jgi:hypothetical protein
MAKNAHHRPWSMIHFIANLRTTVQQYPHRTSMGG